jgi:hypothetical protein
MKKNPRVLYSAGLTKTAECRKSDNSFKCSTPPTLRVRTHHSSPFHQHPLTVSSSLASGNAGCQCHTSPGRATNR